jgi:peptide/nickel transport system permease protein
MNFQVVVLWSDALLFLLIAAIVALSLWARREDALRAAWGRVLKDGVAMSAATVLAAFVLVGLLDSLHYRMKLDAKPGEPVRFAVEVHSALDALLSSLRTRTEKTYSAPLATHLYAKETSTDGTQRDFPRLKHGGAHLGENFDAHGSDIVKRALLGGAAGLALWFLVHLGLRRLGVGADGTATPVALRAVSFTLLPLLLVGAAVAALAGGYHVLGTDKVGQDVLFLTLKSVRTGLLIGTLTTLVMLPLAVLLGILAGYLGGWVDDVIQYLYTTLSSIPGVLLIAAAVLMMQVIIDTHPQWFASSAERADARLLALCLILGMTSWTGVARLLRGETLKLRELEYVQAAQALGVRRGMILLRHILPNLFHLVLISVALDFSSLVLAEAVLSYINIGVDPTMESWGNMINGARLEMARDPVVWWSLAAAFLFMFALVLPANLFADAVRDAFDPRRGD